jgi:hypothetical protein
VERVSVATVERLAGVVEEVQRIDGVLGQIGTKAQLSDDGTLQVVVLL